MTTAIKQGTTRTIAALDVRDGAGAPITSWAGWTAHGVIRAEHVTGAPLATFRTIPGAGEFPIVFTPGLGVTGGSVSITITPAMSSAWTARRIVVQIEIVGPLGPALQTERIIDVNYAIDPEAVT